MSTSITYTYEAPTSGETTVEVTYEYEGVEHTRSVNAVFDGSGNYDSDGTAVRVSEVGLGVIQKINLGVIE
tara:strand:+ start:766 stop:978 length:213 start_codon:yes stop_codon:yes gene_type:complete